MIQYEFQGKDYLVPTKWEDVKFGQFLKIWELKDEIDADKEKYTDFEVNIKNISFLTEIPEEQIDEMLVPDLQEISKNLIFLNTKMPKHKKIEDIQYTFDGKTYMVKNLRSLTTREVKTIERFQKKADTLREAYAPILAVLISPVTMIHDDESGKKVKKFEKFDPDTIPYRHDIVLEMKCIDVFSSIDFFLNTKQI